MTESKKKSPEELRHILDRAECLASASQVSDALDRMARQIQEDYAGRMPVLVGVMVGGVMPLAWLAQRLDIPVQLDYLHATRYRSGTRGGELHWLARPRENLNDRDVLIVDDILDEGITLAAVKDALLLEGPRSIRIAVLVNKIHDRKVAGLAADYVGLEVPDRYVFGCGMDYQEYFRQLPAIYALEED
ncbi:MAG: hypoxanthine-guanine phosphoribosyltransferase [Gammaproteobacteria bacterium]|nr:hypoxanthine-guanine phosphoribosyltransferase [Gammaproteobacteria bacterium]